MARRTHLPEQLAPEARELLIAFAVWCNEERQAPLLKSDDWTMINLIDAFIAEASLDLGDADGG